MSVRPPSLPTRTGHVPGRSSALGSRVESRAWGALLGTALAALAASGCEGKLQVEDLDPADGGPCGRGKARSCECESGQRGIAQCIAGGDWSECVCAETSYDEGEPLPPPDAGHDAGSIRDLKPGDDPLGIPKSSLDCDEHFDMRAHAATGKADPYLVHGGPGLTGSSDLAVCFYFRADNAAGARAIALQPLPDDVSRPHHWLLYGLDDASKSTDGAVGPCKALEPGAYLLGGFYPGSGDVVMPAGTGLNLPTGSAAGYVLEMHYVDPGALELIDRTGVRVCTAPAAGLATAASVHVLGSEGICIPPVRASYEVAGSCSPRRDKGDIHLLSIWPHMHKLGRRMQVTVKHSDGRSEVVHDEAYDSGATVLNKLRDVVITPGDKLETRCTYANDSLLAVPFGEKASDEMCFAFVTAWPAGALSTDPASLDPLRALSVGPQADKRCIDPYSILGSCAGYADSPY